MAAAADKVGMALVSSFQPRAELAAKRVIFGLTTVGAGTTALFAVLFPTVQTQTDTTLTVAGCALIIGLATAMVIRRTCDLWMWVAYPFAAVAMIGLLDVSSDDASLTAQIFFVFPVLYAGAQLRRPAAVAVCVAAIAADLVVTLSRLAWATAVVDTSFLAAVLIAATALLVGGGERNDLLIAELEHQAAVDSLTGLVTRRVLDRVAAATLQGAAEHVGTAMLLVDLDHFKQVNDVHGHPAGDAVLKQLAGILVAVNRRTDVISRMGGDEIAVLMPSCPLESAIERAEEILQEVRRFTFDIGAHAPPVHTSPARTSAARASAAHHVPAHSSSAHTSSAHTSPAEADRRRDLSLSVSIGVAHLPTHGTELRHLYAAADLSLYSAKEAGRNQVGPVYERTDLRLIARLPSSPALPGYATMSADTGSHGGPGSGGQAGRRRDEITVAEVGRPRPVEHR